MRRIIFLGFLGIATIGAASLLLAPETASAQGLVPCGGETQSPCSLCHVFQLLHNIIEFIFVVIVPIVAAFLFAWGGFVWLSSMGNPARVKQGQQILLATVVGILIVYSAWLFISLIFQSFGVITFTGTGKWWEIDCESATVNVQALVAAPGNVFVTSQDYTGNLGGIAGADGKCHNSARSKGYAGTWIAWVSTPGNNAGDRIPNWPFVNFNGETIANDKTQLLTLGALLRPIQYDESGNARTTFVWTGTSPIGEGPAIFLPNTHFCSNWTSGNSSQAGITGDSAQTGDAWTYTPLSTTDPLTCNNAAALYCFLTP